jgi:hypothetical protein
MLKDKAWSNNLTPKEKRKRKKRDRQERKKRAISLQFPW